ncbi:MAG: hypothetical protein ABH871_06455 [Pseudomonadota bacterium]
MKGADAMVLKWIQSLTSQAGRAEVLGQGAVENSKNKRETKLVDVDHEAMRADKQNLDGLVRIGWPNVRREAFKGKVKKKVWDVISGGVDTAELDMIEEITERIVDASEVDSYYRDMFEDE